MEEEIGITEDEIKILFTYVIAMGPVYPKSPETEQGEIFLCCLWLQEIKEGLHFCTLPKHFAADKPVFISWMEVTEDIFANLAFSKLAKLYQDQPLTLVSSSYCSSEISQGLHNFFLFFLIFFLVCFVHNSFDGIHSFSRTQK